MIYLPDKRYLPRFKLLEWPLPRRLLPWLINDRGLGIVVLPKDVKKAQSIIRDRLGIKEKIIPGDGRFTARTSQYRPNRKLIILTHQAFWGYLGENVFLHEVGHAVDFLYSNHSLFSDYQRVKRALQPETPLNSYCAEKQHKNGNLLEQFATSFSAFFREPEDYDETPALNNLSPELIKIFNKTIVEPFE